MSIQDEVLFLLQHYLKVIDASKKPNSTLRLNRAQGLIAKCLDHCASSEYLLRGTNLPEINLSFKDFGTVFVTARAALESLLTFGYVFYLPPTEEDFEYRYNAWILSGLIDRQEFFPDENLIQENKEKVAAEKKEIDEIKTKLNSNQSFLRLTDKQKNRVLQGEWRLDGWTAMGVQIGLNESRMRTIYSFLCAYAHSGGLSGIQYNHLVTLAEDPKQGDFIDPVVAVILANMVNMFCVLFPKSKETHEADKTAIEIVNLYLKLGREAFEVF
jgi:hypothetical protein